MCGIGSPIDFHRLTKGAIVLEPERLKSRQMILDKLLELGIEAREKCANKDENQSKVQDKMD